MALTRLLPGAFQLWCNNNNDDDDDDSNTNKNNDDDDDEFLIGSDGVRMFAQHFWAK